VDQDFPQRIERRGAFSYVAVVLSTHGGPWSDEQQRLAGTMVMKAILLAIFANLTIWGWGKPTRSHK
jgi:hypothetical protein